MKRRVLGALGILAALMLLNTKFSNKHQLAEEDYADEEIQKPVKKRSPASVKQPGPSATMKPFVHQLSSSNREQRNLNAFSDEREITEGSSPQVQGNGGLFISGESSGTRRWDGSDSGAGSKSSDESSSAKTDSTTSSQSPSLGVQISNSPGPYSVSGGDGSESSDALFCTSDLGGGSYGNPIEVSLACTGSSEIRYCVSEGSCCDPLVSGVVYTSKIIIGEHAGDFCLSFYGSGSNNFESKVVQKNYEIDFNLPNLDVSHPKRYYQTTELSGVSHISSDMFGSQNFGVGVINLKSNDPGPSGLNVDCQEIVTNYVSFPAPAPNPVLSFFNTNVLPPTDQLNVPLQLNHLAYGDNFITSYIANNNFAVPLYSCSTTKVRLEDFEYFQADASHAVGITNGIREFSGGFSGYGFFEAETNLNRGPAGESMSRLEDDALETGLFSVFY